MIWNFWDPQGGGFNLGGGRGGGFIPLSWFSLGAFNAALTQCDYLSTSMGKVLCCCLVLSCCALHLCRCTYLESRRARTGQSVCQLHGAIGVFTHNFCCQSICSPEGPSWQGSKIRMLQVQRYQVSPTEISLSRDCHPSQMFCTGFAFLMSLAGGVTSHWTT